MNRWAAVPELEGGRACRPLSANRLRLASAGMCILAIWFGVSRTTVRSTLMPETALSGAAPPLALARAVRLPGLIQVLDAVPLPDRGLAVVGLTARERADGSRAVLVRLSNRLTKRWSRPLRFARSDLRVSRLGNGALAVAGTGSVRNATAGSMSPAVVVAGFSPTGERVWRRTIRTGTGGLLGALVGTGDDLLVAANPLHGDTRPVQVVRLGPGSGVKWRVAASFPSGTLAAVQLAVAPAADAFLLANWRSHDYSIGPPDYTGRSEVALVRFSPKGDIIWKTRLTAREAGNPEFHDVVGQSLLVLPSGRLAVGGAAGWLTDNNSPRLSPTQALVARFSRENGQVQQVSSQDNFGYDAAQALATVGLRVVAAGVLNCPSKAPCRAQPTPVVWWISSQWAVGGRLLLRAFENPVKNHGAAVVAVSRSKTALVFAHLVDGDGQDSVPPSVWVFEFEASK